MIPKALAAKITQARSLGKKWLPLPAWCMRCEGFIKERGCDNDHRHPKWLCEPCENKLPKWHDGICLSCGHVHKMGDCAEDWALSLNSFTAAFGYLDPVKAWIAKFKYAGNLNAGRLLRDLLAEYFRLHPDIFDDIDYIIPVPSYPNKLTQRGFNAPSFLLDQKGLPLNLTAVTKTKATETQAGLHQQERYKNLYRAFAANSEEIEDKRILIFDDVCTTGRTLEEMAITLKRAGADRVDALVLARVVNRT